MITIIAFGAFTFVGYNNYATTVFTIMALLTGLFTYAGCNAEVHAVAGHLQQTISNLLLTGELGNPQISEIIPVLQQNQQAIDADAWNNLSEWHITAIVMGSILCIFLLLGLSRKYCNNEMKFVGGCSKASV